MKNSLVLAITLVAGLAFAQTPAPANNKPATTPAVGAATPSKSPADQSKMDHKKSGKKKAKTEAEKK